MVVIELHFVVVLVAILIQGGGILTHDVVVSTNALLFQPKFDLCSYFDCIDCYLYR